jgi:hypothetical protein
VKLEQEVNAASNREVGEEEKKRMALRARLQVEPDGKTPRRVFRKGNHKRDISNLLGGTASDPFPVAVRDWPPFLKEGDVYVACTADWNPWSPSFAGDSGLIESWIFEEMERVRKDRKRKVGQTTFHMFRECCPNPASRRRVVRPRSAFHGELAAGGYLYCGIYEAERDADGDFEMAQTVSFNQFAVDKECFPETQQTMIQNAYVKRVKTKTRDPVQDRFYLSSDEGDGEARHKAAIRRMFEEEDPSWDVVPVRFVGYDEALYARLVEIGATKRDDKDECPLDVQPTASQAGQYAARVEVDPARLGRLG